MFLTHIFITVELIDDKALSLLKQLEQFNILRLIHTQQPPKSQRKWAGSLSKETANKMLQHVDKSRSEWGRNI